LDDKKSDVQRKVALREAAINATLCHPNIVATYAHDMRPLNSQDSPTGGCIDWQLYLIQEYCNAGTLLTAIEEKGLFNEATNMARFELILPLLTQIARGCAYIHSNNIIHGQSHQK